jgi:hypothetical protein
MMRLSQLKNIGPQTEAWLNEVGIVTIEDLQTVGAVEAWRRVCAVHPRASLNGLYALQGALLGVRWDQLPPEIKADLKHQYDLF